MLDNWRCWSIASFYKKNFIYYLTNAMNHHFGKNARLLKINFGINEILSEDGKTSWVFTLASSYVRK